MDKLRIFEKHINSRSVDKCWCRLMNAYPPQQALTDEAAVAVFVNVRPNNEVLFLPPFLLKVTLYSDV